MRSVSSCPGWGESGCEGNSQGRRHHQKLLGGDQEPKGLTIKDIIVAVLAASARCCCFVDGSLRLPLASLQQVLPLPLRQSVRTSRTRVRYVLCPPCPLLALQILLREPIGVLLSLSLSSVLEPTQQELGYTVRRGTAGRGAASTPTLISNRN